YKMSSGSIVLMCLLCFVFGGGDRLPWAPPPETAPRYTAVETMDAEETIALTPRRSYAPRPVRIHGTASRSYPSSLPLAVVKRPRDLMDRVQPNQTPGF